jgi:hypothetical protein
MAVYNNYVNVNHLLFLHLYLHGPNIHYTYPSCVYNFIYTYGK